MGQTAMGQTATMPALQPLTLNITSSGATTWRSLILCMASAPNPQAITMATVCITQIAIVVDPTIITITRRQASSRMKTSTVPPPTTMLAAETVLADPLSSQDRIRTRRGPQMPHPRLAIERIITRTSNRQQQRQVRAMVVPQEGLRLAQDMPAIMEAVRHQMQLGTTS